MPPRVLLLLPAAGYRNHDFVVAARKLGIEIVAAADHCHRLAPAWGLPPVMALHFDQPAAAADTVLRETGGVFDAVLAVDDAGLALAALLNQRLGLKGNAAEAVERVRDKLAFRQLLQAQGLPCPDFQHLPSDADARSLLPALRFPVVVKARRLAGSRGVIRADDEATLLQAVQRVRAVQARADRDAAALGIVVERFIPGREFALEGSLSRGELTTLALFDKPDPLDGPYFEETLYVTPSRLPPALQQGIHDEVARACRAAGLHSGPIHAEARVDGRGGIWLLEIAPRSIGGLCARVLTDTLGMSLEELILRGLVGLPVALPHGDAGARAGAGVMMIPIPRRGIYGGTRGLDAARAVAGITGVTLTAEVGQLVAPPPDGGSYLGFIFAAAATPAQVESALRQAHARLEVDVRPDHVAVQGPAA